MTDVANGDVRLSLSGGIARLHLNRPGKANSITMPMLETIVGFVQELANSEDVKALVVTAEGKNFSGGVDLAVMDHARTPVADLDRYLALWEDMVSGFEGLPIPVIGAVQGPAIAGGLSISLACDILIATSDARFGYLRIPQGHAPGRHNLSHLVRKIGPGRTKLIFLGARIVTAQEAAQWGLVDDVVEPGSLEDAVQTLLDSLTATPAPLVKLTNGLIDDPENEDLWADATRI